jgi:hypothetical protein
VTAGRRTEVSEPLSGEDPEDEFEAWLTAANESMIQSLNEQGGTEERLAAVKRRAQEQNDLEAR